MHTQKPTMKDVSHTTPEEDALTTLWDRGPEPQDRDDPNGKNN